VASGLPHHVTQRGNHRQQVFFNEGDYEAHRTLLAEGCQAAGGRTDRPAGSEHFVKRLERRLGRTLAQQKPGPKPREKNHLSD